MIPCKICGASAPLHGVVDFSKSCERHRGLILPLRGVAIWYHRCPDCGFLFTRQFDDFTAEDWRRKVYNAEYLAVDPDYAGARAEANAPLVRSIVAQMGLADPLRAGIMIEPPRLLDYGSGGGGLTARLADLPFECAAWDPLEAPEKPTNQFELVTAFEVFEHTPTPVETAKDALGFVRGGGALMLSTLVCDDLPAQSTDWWYLAPRNGHVSIHSTRSLDRLFGDLGWRLQHLNANLHIAMAQ